ncbi:MAG: DNA-directed RNA polymerase subunit A' [Candidatus Parvarchaeota archaeon]|nr:DNA-directed RNA polymerase subunit A' [Candidatus Parvarchaeota archaeon]MCW1301673.1 DNA-directed RNA polymerase subunit A' [Candidatus Parvarchaeota archaeon]
MRLDTNFVFSKIYGIEFGLLSPRMIEKMSSVAITSSELYDIDGFPVDGGLADMKLGVTDPGLICRTCGNTIKDCPGHFGHLELARPIFNVKMVPKIYDLLNATCDSCGRILISDSLLKKATSTMDLIEAREGLIGKKRYVRKLIRHAKSINTCPFCHSKQNKVKLEKPYSFIYNGQKLNAADVRERLERINDADLQFLGLNQDYSRPEWMIFTVLPIPPVTIRPPITLESGQKSEDDLTHKLTDIVRTNQRLAENIKSGAPEVIIEELWDLLQYHITTFISNGTAQVPIARHKSGKKLKTLEDRIKGKEGRFRGSTLGKRANYSARSTISPDSMIHLDEVGVPIQIAREVTYPERVTDINIDRLKSLIKNFNGYPNASYVITPDGIRRKITENTVQNILDEIKPGYIVERSMLNGDIILFNRQPSLHRLSIMGHSVKVLDGKTLRINPASTLPYNADFDGDEMNIHVLQTEEALAEAALIMNIKNNIVSPRHGLPLIGSTQDYISGCAILTRKETRIDKSTAEDFLVFAGIDADLNRPTYSGREIFSMLLPKDLNFEDESSVYKYSKDEDTYVSIKNGKLERGIIDSATIGKENGSLLQYLFVQYGGDVTSKFIDQLSRLALITLTKFGISANISNFDLPNKTMEEIHKIFEDGNKEVESMLKEYDSDVEMKIIALTNKMRGKIRNATRDGITGTANEINYMMITGAKGSIMNFFPTAGMVGQQLLRDARMNNGYEGRLTAHFKRNDMGLIPRGFVVSNYRDGLNPIEFFLHAGSSREGLMDNVIRTPVSGYMNRRLSSALQDLKVADDLSVREGNKIIQFMYGEDGLDVSLSDKGELNI